MIQIATGDNSPVAILLFQFTRHLRDNLPMLFVQHCAVQKPLHKIPTFHFLNLLQHFDRLDGSQHHRGRINDNDEILINFLEIAVVPFG